MWESVSYPQDPGERYRVLMNQLRSLTEGETDPIANLANASALLMNALPDLNWAGFYLLKGDQLVLGPFQGLPACIRIPLGKGVCGTAAATKKLQLVPDVHLFPGHIACDAASASELVIPLLRDGRLLGVLDLDSPKSARFDRTDADALSAMADHLSLACAWSPEGA